MLVTFVTETSVVNVSLTLETSSLRTFPKNVGHPEFGEKWLLEKMPPRKKIWKKCLLQKMPPEKEMLFQLVNMLYNENYNVQYQKHVNFKYV